MDDAPAFGAPLEHEREHPGTGVRTVELPGPEHDRTVGTDRIARWTQLLLYADGRDVPLASDPLVQMVATRARFMELASRRLRRASAASPRASAARSWSRRPTGTLQPPSSI